MNLALYETKQYKKNLKKIFKTCTNKKQKELIIRLAHILEYLINNKALPIEYHDHKLVNSRLYKNCRECHIFPDILLIYQAQITDNKLILVDIGSHSNLFSYQRDFWEELNEINS